jgi:hypothetical protein
MNSGVVLWKSLPYLGNGTHIPEVVYDYRYPGIPATEYLGVDLRNLC